MTQNIPGDHQNQAIHAEVLSAARRISSSGDWTFRLADVVRALPYLNERSVRTHVASRCCVNAPRHHAHRWPYFLRVRRGIYRIEPGFRQDQRESRSGEELGAADRVAEAGIVYDPTGSAERSAIHAVISKSDAWFVVECLEVAVVTQGRTLDETLANLREALALHLDEDEMTRLGLSAAPRLIVSYETAAFAA